MNIDSTEQIRRRLDEIPGDLPLIDQLLQLAGLLSLALKERGLQAIVVGGAAVAIYTKKSETSLDVDLVVEGARLAAVDVLTAIGLEPGRSAGVFWYRKLGLPVEIPDNTLAGDPDRVVEILLDDGLSVLVIGIDDLVLDRAEQAVAQKSPSSDVRRQALLLIATYWEELDWSYLEKEARQRDFGEYMSKLIAEAQTLRE